MLRVRCWAGPAQQQKLQVSPTEVRVTHGDRTTLPVRSTPRNSGAAPFESPSLAFSQEHWGFEKQDCSARGGGSSEQPFAVVLHIHHLPVIHGCVCSHHRQCSFHWLGGCSACQRVRGNWPAFKISSQGLLNQLPCLCALLAVCLVICCTLCTLCSSYRLAFYFLQRFLSLCQHLATCSFNAYR